MHRQDLVVEIEGQVDQAHTGVVGADQRIGTAADQAPRHRQGLQRIGPVIGAQQLHRPAQDPPVTIELLSRQHGTAPHVASVRLLIAAQRPLQADQHGLARTEQSCVVHREPSQAASTGRTLGALHATGHQPPLAKRDGGTS